jgi:hypothetical protein
MWTWTAPRYGGPLKTKLRFRLNRVSEDPNPTYSAEFEGSVDPEMFLKPREEGEAEDGTEEGEPKEE